MEMGHPITVITPKVCPFHIFSFLQKCELEAVTPKFWVFNTQTNWNEAYLIQPFMKSAENLHKKTEFACLTLSFNHYTKF